MTTDPGAGGYHWPDSGQADCWDACQRELAAERADGFTAMLAQLPVDLATPGETTVTVRGNGRGGRNAEFLASASTGSKPKC